MDGYGRLSKPVKQARQFSADLGQCEFFAWQRIRTIH